MENNEYVEVQWQILDTARTLPLLREGNVSKFDFNVHFFPTKKWKLRLVMMSSKLCAVIEPGPGTKSYQYDICLLTVDGKKWSWGQTYYSQKNMLNVILCSACELKDEKNGLYFLNYLTVSVRLFQYPDIEVSPPFVLSCRSEAGIGKSIIWSVRNISDLAVGKAREYVVDKNTEESKALKLSLFLYKDDVCLSALSHLGTGGLVIEAVCIINTNGENVACLNEREFISVDKTSTDTSNAIPFIKMQELNNNKTLLRYDTLTINIRFRDFNTFCNSTLQSVTHGLDVHPWTWASPAELLGDAECHRHRLAENFSSIRSIESDSDFTLRVGPESIPAHKVVLKARSVVFDRMLKSNMLESTQNEMQIPDFSPESVRRLLQFLYSGEVPDLNPRNAVELYELADKYEVLDLRLQCSRVLASNLCAPYACKLASLAYARSDEVLKRRLLAFISANLQDVLDSPEWLALRESDPKLTSHVMQDLLLKKPKERLPF